MMLNEHVLIKLIMLKTHPIFGYTSNKYVNITLISLIICHDQSLDDLYMPSNKKYHST